MRTIAQRDLRNSISEILRDVEAGDTCVVTVAGRPVAELRPVTRRRRWVSRAAIEAAFGRGFSADDAFLGDIHKATDDALRDPWERGGR